MLQIIEKVRELADNWDEVLEPPASESEIRDMVDKVKFIYSVELPKEYLDFLKTLNGLEFNGFIIYGTKNSEISLDDSRLDILEMNEVASDSIRLNIPGVIIIGEDSSGIIVYDSIKMEFQYRDRIGIDRIFAFSSFEEMLKVEVEKVSN